MKTITRACLSTFALILLLAPAGLRAQEAPPVPDQVKRLHAIVGDWEGTGTITTNGETVTFPLRHTNTLVAGGLGIQIVEAAEIPGMGTYDGVNLFGYNAGDDRMHLFSVVSDGSVHDHAGRWTSDRTMTVQFAGLQDGQAFTEVIPITIDSDQAYHFSSLVYVNGELASRFDGAMKRRSGAVSAASN